MLVHILESILIQFLFGPTDYSESSPAVFVIKTFVGYFESHLVEYNIVS